MSLDALARFIEKWKWPVLAFIYWVIVFQNIPHSFLDFGGDSSQYIIVAESLASGHGYRMPNYPQNPICTVYPPVFPLLLSPIVKFFGRNFLLMHFLVALLGFLSLIFLYLIFKKYSGRQLAFFTVLFISLNWSYLFYSAIFILSEIPYIFFSCFTLWILSKYIEKESYFNLDGIMLVLGLCLSYFTRAIGVVLALGAIFTLYLANNNIRLKKIVFVCAGFLPLFFIWNLFKFFYRSYVISQFKLLFVTDLYDPSQGTLLAHPVFFITRLLGSLNYYTGEIAQITLGYLFRNRGLSDLFLVLFVMGAILIGFWQSFREEKKCVFNYYFILYFFLILFWPAREGPRFLLPVLPFLTLYFFIGLKKISGLFNRKVQIIIFPAAISAIFIFNLLFLGAVFNKTSLDYLPEGLSNLAAMHNWIKGNLKDKEVVFSRKPTVTYFFTGHKAIVYPYTDNPEQIWEEAEKNKVRYIIVDEFSQETYRYLSPFLYKYADKLKLLHHVGETGLFEIEGGK